MKKVLSYILTLLFPREQRKSRFAKLTSEALLPFVRYERRHIEDIYVTTLFSYEDILIRDLIWTLKYEGSRHAALLCAEMLADFLLEEITESATFDAQPPLLIPIPLAPEREQERGYNQVRWIAEALLPLLNNRLELHEKLVRVRHTPRQTTLSRRDRKENVTGAFEVGNPETISGRHCILLDDVVTTGSTLLEAGRTLKAAGAKSVDYWAIAGAGKE